MDRTGNITGLSLVMGGMSGLNTLSSQSFGAGNYPQLGVLLQRTILMCLCLLVPIGVAWFTGTSLVLQLIGIDQAQADMSARFAKVYFFVLPAMLTVQAIQTFFRAQRIVKPITKLSVVGAILNIPIVWACVSTWGFIGAPIAQVLAAWLLLALYALYFSWNGLHKTCWAGWTKEALTDWAPLAKLSAAGTASMMGMWWSWEILMGLAGTLGAINLAAHASLTSMVSLYWSWIGCTSMTACVRIGNHLGAGDPDRARCAAKAPVIFLGVILGTVWTICMTNRRRLAYMYTSDDEVAALSASVLPVYLLSQSMAACSFGFKGMLDGCGKQLAFARYSMCSWYLVGIPLAAAGVLYWDWGLQGQWIGMCVGNGCCLCGVAFYCYRLSFDKVSEEAVARATRKSQASTG
jgi:MATE family multidrug resistance protein